MLKLIKDDVFVRAERQLRGLLAQTFALFVCQAITVCSGNRQGSVTGKGLIWGEKSSKVHS